MPTQIKTKANTRKPVSKPKKESILEVAGTEAEELGEGLLNPSPTSEVKPIKKAFEKGVENSPGPDPIKIAEETKKKAEEALHKAESWTQAIGNFFHSIVQVHLWERIGKIALGLIMLVFGIYFFSKAVGRG